MNCPDEKVWFDVAAGTISNEESLRYAQHAASCSSCAKKLKAAARIFADDLSPEETRLLNSLSDGGSYQHKPAERLSVSADSQPHSLVRSKQSGQRRTWGALTSAGAIAAVLVVAILIAQRDPASNVERRVASIYTENRTIQMRIPMAAYSDLRQRQSGEDTSLAISSPAFRKAIDEISEGERKHPGDARWRILHARLDLVDWRYKEALSILDEIHDTGQLSKGLSDDLLLTRAIALYEKGEFQDTRETFGEAENLLAQVLKDSPDDSVALFNRAIVCEKLLQHECASKDWHRLLEIEKDRGWAGEASAHLRQWEGKKNSDR